MVQVQDHAIAVEIGFRVNYQPCVDAWENLRQTARDHQDAACAFMAGKWITSTVYTARTRDAAITRTTDRLHAGRDHFAAALLGIPQDKLQTLRALAVNPPTVAGTKPRTRKAEVAATYAIPTVQTGIAVNCGDLNAALGQLKYVAGTKSCWPILNCVLLDPTKDNGGIVQCRVSAKELTITGFDLEAGVSLTIPAEVASDANPVAVNFHALRNALTGAAKSDTITMDLRADSAVVRVGTSETIIPGFPADEFRALPSTEGLTWHNADGLIDTMKQAGASCSTDESKAILQGVLVSRDRCVGADGYRLFKADHGCNLGEDFADVLVPAKFNWHGMMGLDKSAQGVEVAVNTEHSQIWFRSGSTLACSRLIDGQFPVYERAIPAQEDCPNAWVMDAKELTKALRQVNGVAKENAHRVILTSGNRKKKSDMSYVTLTATSGDEVATAKVLLHAEEGAMPYEFACNTQYLMDAIRFCEQGRDKDEMDSVIIAGSGPLESFRVTPLRNGDSCVAVCMPMQIR